MRKLEVVERHHAFFLDSGFIYDPAFSLYTKQFSHGKQAVFLHFTDSEDGNLLEYSLGVRIDQVENIIHKFLPSLSDYSERSLTLVQTPNKIGKELPRVFHVSTNWELSQAMMKAEKFFVSDGFPWLDQMIDPVLLERAFFHKRDYSFKTQNFIYNAFRATALAKLFNPKDYHIIRDGFLSQINRQHMTPFTIASYLQFLSFLDQLH
ncbi:hypothetical protein [Algoriphagus zhangzhouensis]|uniref:Uncharacterized protein n=1 Tax=Algoriphagus zhangzhouensis TaxID=1073327 RepID=A0A1M7Z5C9_9BACT|nr:hypothetical protein [Algoriphagus zhangzhouensis]TDY48873.1 hypothetical protein A8938_0562 [Algoriphagus zhangzhouensis]SHO60085.1 hypothetical protein SAMN04488108_0562 [Algoriphagus zhangzhouensis]